MAIQSWNSGGGGQTSSKSNIKRWEDQPKQPTQAQQVAQKQQDNTQVQKSAKQNALQRIGKIIAAPVRTVANTAVGLAKGVTQLPVDVGGRINDIAQNIIHPPQKPAGTPSLQERVATAQARAKTASPQTQTDIKNMKLQPSSLTNVIDTLNAPKATDQKISETIKVGKEADRRENIKLAANTAQAALFGIGAPEGAAAKTAFTGVKPLVTSLAANTAIGAGFNTAAQYATKPESTAKEGIHAAETGAKFGAATTVAGGALGITNAAIKAPKELPQILAPHAVRQLATKAEEDAAATGVHTAGMKAIDEAQAKAIPGRDRLRELNQPPEKPTTVTPPQLSQGDVPKQLNPGAPQPIKGDGFVIQTPEETARKAGITAKVNTIDRKIKTMQNSGIVDPRVSRELLQQKSALQTELEQGQATREYKTVHEGGEIKTVSGEPVKLVEGVDTFVHPGDGGYVVSESSTGRFLAESRTKEAAIAKARSNINDVGIDKFKQLLSEKKLDQTPSEPRTGVPTLEGGRPAEINPISGDLKPLSGAGETRTSKLASGVEQKAIENKLTTSLGDLPEYSQVNMKDQARFASELLSTDEQKAINIATGKEQPPSHILPESVFTAVEDKALRDNNIELIRQLAHSSRVGEATAMGQRIRALAERNPDSPVGAIKQVLDVRREAAEKRLGTTMYKATTKTASEIAANIKKPTKMDWAQFVESIKC